MILTASQIKAARAMLDWTQDNLAEESGLSPNTIHSLEKGNLSIRSLMEVRKTLESKGFKFYGKNGLSRSVDETKVYEGADSRERFYDDLLAIVHSQKCDIAAFFRSQELLANCLGATDASHLEPLAKFAPVKCLLSEARPSTFSVLSYQFRVTQHYPIGILGSLIYSDHTAIVVTNGTDYTFVVIPSVEIAARSRTDFTQRWDSASPLSISSRN